MRGWKLGLVLLGLAIAGARAQVPEEGPPALNIAPPATQGQPEEKLTFAMGEGVGRGDLIYVPVTLGGKERMFVVDTGAGSTIVDSALTEFLGPERAEFEAKAAGGATLKLKQYQMPSLVVGGKSLATRGLVCAMDCGLLRRGLGRPIEGIVGADVMSRHVVRLDFGQRILEIGDLRIDKDPGTSFPLQWAGGTPFMTAGFVGIPEVPVLLDSGAVCGGMAEGTLGKLGRDDVTEYVQAVWDASGLHTSSMYAVHHRWSLAGVTFEDALLDRDQNNKLGLAELADFAVTIDFPNERVYLKKLKDAHVNKPLTKGLPLLLDGGRFLIAPGLIPQVTPSVEEGDELLQIGGRDVRGMELWQVKERMHEPKTVTITIQRGEKRLEIPFHGEDPPMRAVKGSATTLGAATGTAPK